MCVRACVGACVCVECFKSNLCVMTKIVFSGYKQNITNRIRRPKLIFGCEMVDGLPGNVSHRKIKPNEGGGGGVCLKVFREKREFCHFNAWCRLLFL